MPFKRSKGFSSDDSSPLSKTDSNANEEAPEGCVSERLNEFAPKGVLEHVELPTSLKETEDGKKIPHQLFSLLETIKNQYLAFTKTMQVRRNTVFVTFSCRLVAVFAEF